MRCQRKLMSSLKILASDADIANTAAHILVDQKRDGHFTCDFGCLFVLFQHLPAFLLLVAGLTSGRP
jgi:hypothetical protein